MNVKINIKYGWFPSIQLVLFGPAENLLINDIDVNTSAIELANLSPLLACQFLSNRDNISKRIDRMGIEVDYVGTIIADLFKDGNSPMVW